MVTTFYKPGEYPYSLGRGIVRIKKGTETAWKDLFHVKEFKFNITADELEHETMRAALKRTDKSIITKMKASGSFVVDVPAVDTVMEFLLGSSVTTDVQTSGSYDHQEFTVVEPGRWQTLSKRDLTITSIVDDGAVVPATGTAGGTNTGNGTCTDVTGGIAIQNGTYTLECTAAAADGGTFSVTAPDATDLGDATVGTPFTSTHINFTINDGATDFAVGDTFTIVITGVSTLVEATDYLVDKFYGAICPLVGSTKIGTAGDKFRVTGSYAAHTKYQVQAGQTSQMLREIWFAGDPATGIKTNVFVYAMLRPNGDLAFIGDDWQGFTFDFTCQEHTTYGELGLLYEDYGKVANA